MSFFKALSIKFKIYCIAFIGITGLCVSLAMLQHVINSAAIALHDVENIHYPTIESFEVLSILIEQLSTTFNDAIILEDEDELAGCVALKLQFEQKLGKLTGVLGQPSVDRISAVFNQYYDVADQLALKAIDGELDDQHLVQQSGVIRDKLEQLKSSLKTARKTVLVSFASYIEYAIDNNTQLFNTSSLLFVFIFIVLILTCRFIATLITHSIIEVSKSLSQMSEGKGDLKTRLQVTSSDEVGHLTKQFNTFLDNLYPLIKSVKETAFVIDSANQNTLEIMIETSVSVKNQVKGTEQVASAIEQMANTVKSVNQLASSAATLADRVSRASLEGSEEVKTTSEMIQTLTKKIAEIEMAVQSLTKNSLKINSVLNVISNISAQTNLLALNAAIEAARAGDAGRGFAVVADEVRSLAKLSQNATQEIQKMTESLQTDTANITEIMESSLVWANNSVNQVGLAKDALVEISLVVDEINETNRDVAKATEEQSDVAKHISESTHGISELAAQISKAIANTNKKCADQTARVRTLTTIVNQFQT
ncbi:MAG: methyl-accepting chemotaxis protein [Algicola sp.]|nr:methyl-accepting chemotaxis protein [Algicola sp.]